MEEDQLAFGSDDLAPDEQQLEVLEDIWLKAGEIGKNIKNVLIQKLYLIPYNGNKMCVYFFYLFCPGNNIFAFIVYSYLS